MAISRVGRVAVCIHDAVAPTDDEWTRWIALCEELPGEAIRVLVETPLGTGPNPKQRKQLADALHSKNMRAAVLTDSLVVRGVLTALAWLGVSVRGFGMLEHASAAAHLGLSDEELSQALQELSRLHQEIHSQGTRGSARR